MAASTKNKFSVYILLSEKFTKNRYVNLIHMQYNEGNSTIESGRTTSNFASKSYLKSNYGLAYNDKTNI